MKDQDSPAGDASPQPPTHEQASRPSASYPRVDHTVVDWYYHDPGEGRVGPYSAEDMRKRFRDRRIQRDTLVWRHGLREWQPLDRVSDEVGIDDIVPDASKPPPMLPAAAPPAPRAAGGFTTGGPAPHSKYARQPLKRNKHVVPIWAIVLAVLAALSIPACAILLPAYQGYAKRANTGAALTGAGAALTRNVARYHAARGTCPTMADPQVAQMARQLSEYTQSQVRFGRLAGGVCMFEFTLRHEHAEADGKTLRYIGWEEDGDFVWDCSEGSLPDAWRPAQCRAGDA